MKRSITAQRTAARASQIHDAILDYCSSLPSDISLYHPQSWSGQRLHAATSALLFYFEASLITGPGRPGDIWQNIVTANSPLCIILNHYMYKDYNLNSSELFGHKCTLTYKCSFFVNNEIFRKNHKYITIGWFSVMGISPIRFDWKSSNNLVI